MKTTTSHEHRIERKMRLNNNKRKKEGVERVEKYEGGKRANDLQFNSGT